MASLINENEPSRLLSPLILMSLVMTLGIKEGSNKCQKNRFFSSWVALLLKINALAAVIWGRKVAQIKKIPLKFSGRNVPKTIRSCSSSGISD